MPGSGVTRTISYGLRLMHLLVLYSLTNINTAKFFLIYVMCFILGAFLMWCTSGDNSTTEGASVRNPLFAQMAADQQIYQNIIEDSCLV